MFSITSFVSQSLGACFLHLLRGSAGEEDGSKRWSQQPVSSPTCRGLKFDSLILIWFGQVSLVRLSVLDFGLHWNYNVALAFITVETGAAHRHLHLNTIVCCKGNNVFINNKNIYIYIQTDLCFVPFVAYTKWRSQSYNHQQSDVVSATACCLVMIHYVFCHSEDRSARENPD